MVLACGPLNCLGRTVINYPSFAPFMVTTRTLYLSLWLFLHDVTDTDRCLINLAMLTVNKVVTLAEFIMAYALNGILCLWRTNAYNTKYSKSKFSRNTTNLLSIKVATCFDSRSHHKANYWTMFEVRQVKVHIFGIPKCLRQWENVGTNEVDIYNIIYVLKCIHVLLNP